MENAVELRKSINELVVKHKQNYDRYDNIQNELLNTIQFCERHKFEEETRIARIKFTQINSIIYDYKCLLNEVNELKRLIKLPQ